MGNALAAFQERLGHRFARPDLLDRALTHSSRATDQRPDNERLEFLGDRVLNLTIADALFQADDAAAEGQLAPRYNVLVRKETCAEVATELGLGDVLQIGRSEQMTGGRRKTALLGDAMEAVIAAIYLDAGFEAARDVVRRHWRGRIVHAAAAARDPKSALQEAVQARGEVPPSYVEVGRTGPDHAPRFTIEVRLADGRCATAEGTSKRVAERAAAEALLAQMTGTP